MNVFHIKKVVARVRRWLGMLGLGLCVFVLRTSCPVAAAAEAVPPLILMPGFSGPALLQDAGTKNERLVWPIQMQEQPLTLWGRMATLLPKLLFAPQAQQEAIIDESQALMQLLAPLELNDDGSSVHAITPTPQGAHNSRWDVMKARKLEHQNNQKFTTNAFMQDIPAERMYLFASDWRQGHVYNAKKLAAFIEDVMADANSQSVNLFAVSNGGLLAATYFTLYQGAHVDKAILHGPALDGALLVQDLLESDTVAFDLATAIDFLGIYLGYELSAKERLPALDLKQSNRVAMEALRQWLLPFVQKLGCFWDILPSKYYETLKAQWLDPVQHAEIIRKSDVVHKQVMPHLRETFLAMQAAGKQIIIVAGSALPLVSGGRTDSDGIIDTASTTGAQVLPWSAGAQLTDLPGGCKDRTHRHRAPGGRIDAATAYLPEHTWFFAGQYHGQVAHDVYGYALCVQFLTTDLVRDVHSTPQFPQFRYSANPADGLDFQFDQTVNGYLAPAATQLQLQNLSQAPIRILRIGNAPSDYLPLEVDYAPGELTLAPGEVVGLPLQHKAPKTQEQTEVQVDFVRENALPTRESRTLAFCVLPLDAPVPEALQRPTEPVPQPQARWRADYGLPTLGVAFGTVVLAALYVLRVQAYARKKM